MQTANMSIFIKKSETFDFGSDMVDYLYSYTEHDIFINIHFNNSFK